jgi:hypothetical protein
VYLNIFYFFSSVFNFVSRKFVDEEKFARDSNQPNYRENSRKNEASSSWSKLSNAISQLVLRLRENSRRVNLRDLVHKDLLV